MGQLAVDTQHVYWIENCPGEGGRNTVVQLAEPSTPQSLIPSPFNVRTRVHEYGGGAYVVFDGTIYFSNFSDQRIYRYLHHGSPEPITPAGPYRFADGVIDRHCHRMICIREDHTQSDQGPENAIVSIPLVSTPDGHAGTILVSGNDFYSTPRLSPDGHQLAWLTWNHPNMPWDETKL